MERYQHYIGGQWVDSASADWFDSVNPYTGKVWAEIAKGNATDAAIKLIVKISEGSVRDALSLLDRALVSQEEGSQLDLKTAQKIFGYFDKSNLIELFKYIFEGEEKKVIDIYRFIYDQGVEPKIFLNDFLELLYYFKNISS